MACRREGRSPALVLRGQQRIFRRKMQGYQQMSTISKQRDQVGVVFGENE